MNIDRTLNKKLNLIIDRYLKLKIPFKDIEKYLTGKNINKIIKELYDIEEIYLKNNKNKDSKDFKKITKKKIKDIIKDRKYNYIDKNESLKYIKLYEDLDWEFDEEETPNIHPDFKKHENFYNFLIKNRLLDRYIYNFNNDPRYKRLSGYTYDLKKFLNNRKDERYILDAFDWAKDEFNFWSSINESWQFDLEFNS